MKALPDKAIIYDSNCPMCSLYTGGFVKWGLLEKQNRISFDELDSTTLSGQLDLHQAKHQIPLIDLQGGKTIYGLDALLFIIGSKIPFIHCIFRFKPIYAFWAGLYDIVSYNRRIIVPANISTGQKDFAPDLSTKHRLFFIGISLLLSGLLFYKFGSSLNTHLNIPRSSSQMIYIVTTGWLGQFFMGLVFSKSQKLDFTGHLSVVLLIGALVLIPCMIADAVAGYQFMFIPVTGVLISSTIMLWQHVIRIRHLRLSQSLTLSWFLILLTTITFWIYLFYFNN